MDFKIETLLEDFAKTSTGACLFENTLDKRLIQKTKVDIDKIGLLDLEEIYTSNFESEEAFADWIEFYQHLSKEDVLKFLSNSNKAAFKATDIFQNINLELVPAHLESYFDFTALTIKKKIKWAFRQGLEKLISLEKAIAQKKEQSSKVKEESDNLKLFLIGLFARFPFFIDMSNY